MAYSNPILLTIFLITFTFSFSLLPKVKPDSFSFNFPSFQPNTLNIIVDGDANITAGGILQLTKKDYFGSPSPHSVGISGFLGTIHLLDETTGKVADFTTEFSFVVDTKGSQLHGDGFTFFLTSLDFDFPDNETKDGGFFGIFDKDTAFNTSANKVVAVEFDSFSNEWDPNFPGNSPHIGIDINTIRSAITAPWPIDNQPRGSIGKARISYSSSSKELSVLVSYPNSPSKDEIEVSYPIDFTEALSEFVLVGFSASTGELTETHDILSWSFTSSL